MIGKMLFPESVLLFSARSLTAITSQNSPSAQTLIAEMEQEINEFK